MDNDSQKVVPSTPKKQKPPVCTHIKTPIAEIKIINEKYRQNIENAVNNG